MSDLPGGEAPTSPGAGDVAGETDDRDGAIDFASRELCPDGACTGVIGDDGRCRVCGRQGAAPRAAADDALAGDPSPAAVAESAALAEGEPPGLAAAALVTDEDSLDLDGRELCPDGACTGVIGPDGRCRECGRLASAPPGPA